MACHQIIWILISRKKKKHCIGNVGSPLRRIIIGRAADNHYNQNARRSLAIDEVINSRKYSKCYIPARQSNEEARSLVSPLACHEKIQPWPQSPPARQSHPYTMGERKKDEPRMAHTRESRKVEISRAHPAFFHAVRGRTAGIPWRNQKQRWTETERVTRTRGKEGERELGKRPAHQKQ